MTHSDSCDNLFVTELLVHANLCIKSSQRWSSLTGGFRTLKHCVKIHQITLCFCGVFLVMVLLFNFALHWVVLQLPGKYCPGISQFCSTLQYPVWFCGSVGTHQAKASSGLFAILGWIVSGMVTYAWGWHVSSQEGQITLLHVWQAPAGLPKRPIFSAGTV